MSAPRKPSPEKESYVSLLGASPLDGKVASLPPASPFDGKVASLPPASPLDGKVASLPPASPFDAKVASLPPASPFDAKVASLLGASPLDGKVASLPPASPFDAKVASLLGVSPFDAKVASLPPASPFDAKVASLQAASTVDTAFDPSNRLSLGSAVAFDPHSLIKANRSAEARKLADQSNKCDKKYFSNLATNDPEQYERRKELAKETSARQLAKINKLAKNKERLKWSNFDPDVKEQVFTHIDQRKRGLKVLNIKARGAEDWCKQLGRYYNRHNTPNGINQIKARNIYLIFKNWNTDANVKARKKFGLLKSTE